MGVGRRFYDTVVVKVTVTLSDDPVVAEQQAPIYLADEPWDVDRVEVSSLKRAGDVLLYKPSTDIIVTGTARAPREQPTQSWDAAVEVLTGGRNGACVASTGSRTTQVATYDHPRLGTHAS